MDDLTTPAANANQPNLVLSAEDLSYLRGTRKWGKFLAILAFIFLGIFVLAAFAMGMFMGNMSSEKMPIPGFAVTVIYLLFALLYLFPTLYLYRFASSLGHAIEQHDQQALTTALQNQKSLYKFWGVMMVIVMVFYALAIVIGIGVMMMKG